MPKAKQVENPDEVVVDEGELNPNDAEVRALRERAIEYADRVMAGEEPWKDAEEGEGPKAPSNDDVGEFGEGEEEPVEVPDSVADEPAADADDPVQVGDPE